MAAAMKAMTTALREFKTGTPGGDNLLPFDERRIRIGFDDYLFEEKHYAEQRRGKFEIAR